MTKPSYRVIHNQDCNNIFYITKEPIEPRHVEEMVDNVADGGADAMLINPNAQLVNYPSKVWQTFWDGYEPNKREFFGPVPDGDVDDNIAIREHWVRQMANLAAQGCDYLMHSLQHCRNRGITPGVSVRMNDMHDSPWPGTHFFSRFYMEHPDLHLSNPNHLGWGATGLNYAHEAVRQYYLLLIRELVTEYDFDILELDFLRFANYFPRGRFAEHCAIMTGFIREVRELLYTSGRSIALIPRIAATPANAKELGFDIKTWAQEGLIDAVTVGMFLNTGWEMPVDTFRTLVGDDVGIYAGADSLVCWQTAADQRDDLPARYLPLEAELIRGFAAGHLASGADGIHLFNFFGLEGVLFEVLAELKSLEGLRGKAKNYLITAGTSQLETDLAVQVPVQIASNQAREFKMLLAAEPETAKVEAAVVFEGSGVVDQLWLQINDLPIGFALKLQDTPHGQCHTHTAIFSIPATALNDGKNRIVLRNEGDPLTVLGIELHVQSSLPCHGTGSQCRCGVES